MRKETVLSKKSYGWEQLLKSILYRTKTRNGGVYAISSARLSQIISQGLLILALVSLWWWNWQLLLSAGVGVSLMWLTYKVSAKQWRRLWQTIVGLLTGSNRKLVFAVGGGSLGGFITYLFAVVWADTENHWLAVSSILQGFGILTTLILLGWHISRDSKHRTLAKFEQLLKDLTAYKSLKRFIAIRQLTNLARKKALDSEQKLQLVEYFHFMLSQPQEPSIQSALLDSLDILGVSNLSFSQPPRAKTPIRLQESVREIEN